MTSTDRTATCRVPRCGRSVYKHSTAPPAYCLHCYRVITNYMAWTMNGRPMPDAD